MTEQFRSYGAGSPPPVPQHQQFSPPVAASKPPWFRRTWVIATGVGLLGLTFGSAAGASGAPDVKTTPEYKSVASELKDAEGDLDDAETELQDAKAELVEIAGDVPEREAAVTKIEEALAKREAAVAAKEKDVVKRESAVGVIEKEIAKNTIAGEGVYEVGVDMKPGTYKTTGTPGCYYAVLNSPDTSDIASNNNVDGPAIVSVRKGQFLELSGCEDWVLQR